MESCVHIYTGDGKGKTTACVGLAVRCAGSGKKVLFTQFLKDGKSSEINSLKMIPGIEVFSCKTYLGLPRNMDDAKREMAKAVCEEYFEEIIKKAADEKADLLVLDEILGAVKNGFISEDRVIEFLKTKPESMEVAMSGRNPSERLVDMADYVSEIEKKKHPFDVGIFARKGIEF